MSNPLADYLSALEARDEREQAHAEYINAFTRLADRTSALSAYAAPATPAIDQKPSPSPSSSKSIRPGTPKGKTSPTPSTEPSNLAQLRADLASTQKHRAELETSVSTLTAELSALKVTDTEQRKRIAQLEKVKENLERRVRDRAEEIRGKGKFVEEVQDEMVALNLQLNIAEQEREKLKRENEELTRRWVKKMEEEAKWMNENNDRKWVGKKK